MQEDIYNFRKTLIKNNQCFSLALLGALEIH